MPWKRPIVTEDGTRLLEREMMPGKSIVYTLKYDHKPSRKNLAQVLQSVMMSGGRKAALRQDTI